MEDRGVILASWTMAKSLPVKHGLGSKAIPWTLHIWDQIRSLHMEPSPLPVLMDSSSEGLAEDRGARQGLQYGLSGAVKQADPKPEPLSASIHLR